MLFTLCCGRLSKQIDDSDKNIIIRGQTLKPGKHKICFSSV